jgi:hypothetical protein
LTPGVVQESAPSAVVGSGAEASSAAKPTFAARVRSVTVGFAPNVALPTLLAKTMTHTSHANSSAVTPSPTGPPVLTKAVASMILGVLSLPTCVCFGIPSLALGGLAIWLGVWVQQNYRGTTASEFANLYAWVGIIFWSIGLLLGLIGVVILTVSGAGAFIDALRQANP